MGSYDFGKTEVRDYLIGQWGTREERIEKDYIIDQRGERIERGFVRPVRILDVGACDGKWADLLGGDFAMDAVEVFEPYVEQHDLWDKYDHVFITDIRNFKYGGEYDIIIFGDVIEHLPVEDAQKVLEYAKSRAADVIVAVPFQYEQGAINGNPYEVHIQDDLTPELFEERYPGYELFLIDEDRKYAYYKW